MKNKAYAGFHFLCLLSVSISLSGPVSAAVDKATTHSILSIMYGAVDRSPDGDDDNDGLKNADEDAFGSLSFDPDSDDDGLTDLFEFTYTGPGYTFDPRHADESQDDPDSDVLTNLEEQAAGTNPLKADTDSDGLDDYQEVNTYPTSPTEADSDNDGLLDGFEVLNSNGLRTFDPLGTDESQDDEDMDGLTNAEEQMLGTNPGQVEADLDEDGIADIVDTCPGDAGNDPDGDNVCFAVDNCPLNANADQADSDGDGKGDVCDSMPQVVGVDSDADGVPDKDANGSPVDNCPYWPNADQLDSNGDHIGNACQCGDINGDGDITQGDYNLFNSYRASPTSSLDIARFMPLSALERCDVDGDGVCTESDFNLLAAYLGGNGQIETSCPTLSVVANRALTRVAYGPDKWSRQRIADWQQDTVGAANSGYSGIDGYILEQLEPGKIADPDFEKALLRYSKKGLLLLDSTDPDYPDFPTVGMWAGDMKTQYCNTSATATCVDRKDGTNRLLVNSSEIKLLRSIKSRRQLDAVLLDLWFNHFNIVADDGDTRWTLQDFEQAIHKNMYGAFSSLLTASTESPAMLEYLDNQYSSKNSNNENFARELMELHTVGLARDGFQTYEHASIVSAVRVLTGYHYITLQDSQVNRNSMTFSYDASRHDSTTDPATGAGKIITMGQAGVDQDVWHFGFDNDSDNTSCDGMVASKGYNEGKVLLCLLAKDKRTADRIGRILITRFLGDSALYDADPGLAPVPETLNGLLSQVISTWTSTEGDLSEVVKTVLLSDDFKRSLYFEDNKVKRPTVFVASLARALGPGSEGASSNATHSGGNVNNSSTFNELIWDVTRGQEEMYMHSPPDGYSESSDSWRGAANIVNHFRTVMRLLETYKSETDPNKLDLSGVLAYLDLAPGYSSNIHLINDVADALGVKVGHNTLAAVNSFVEASGTSATDQDKAERALIGVLSSPEFLSH